MEDTTSQLLCEFIPCAGAEKSSFITLCEQLGLDRCTADERTTFVLEFARVARLRYESVPHSSNLIQADLQWREVVSTLIAELSPRSAQS